jgi:hypothetical protein
LLLLTPEEKPLEKSGFFPFHRIGQITIFEAISKQRLLSLSVEKLNRYFLWCNTARLVSIMPVRGKVKKKWPLYKILKN